MNLLSKIGIATSISTILVGTVAYFLGKRSKSHDEIMEVIFTHDKCEEATNGTKYLEVSNLNFSPKNLARIEEYINAATKTIDAAVYLFNVRRLSEALIKAHERGVTVRVVGCTSMQGATGTQFLELQNAGITVLFKNTTMCMHHKFCLIDTRDQTEVELKNAQKVLNQSAKRRLKKSSSITQKNDDEKSEKELNHPNHNHVIIPNGGICITGSCNWTMQGFSSNWENVIITSHRKIVTPFCKEFDRIWKDFIKSRDEYKKS